MFSWILSSYFFSGVIINFEKMKKMKLLRDDIAGQHTVVVQPGVNLKELGEFLEQHGLFFPVDAEATKASIGGMVRIQGFSADVFLDCNLCK